MYEGIIKSYPNNASKSAVLFNAVVPTKSAKATEVAIPTLVNDFLST